MWLKFWCVVGNELPSRMFNYSPINPKVWVTYREIRAGSVVWNVIVWCFYSSPIVPFVLFVPYFKQPFFWILFYTVHVVFDMMGRRTRYLNLSVLCLIDIQVVCFMKNNFCIDAIFYSFQSRQYVGRWSKFVGVSWRLLWKRTWRTIKV